MDLNDFFTDHPRVAVAFSGGVDSSYTLACALDYAQATHAYFVKSAFQPAFELEDARRVADQLGAPLTVLDVDVLANPQVTANPADRCYFCKQTVFGTIASAARVDGFEEIVDGTNATDDASDRPGMKALAEMGVLSPLRLCGIGKADVRRGAKAHGLPTWDKPSYACLATRIPTGQKITAENLARTERAESFLFDLGFSDLRVRTVGNAAKIQLPANQIPLLMMYRREIVEELSADYSDVWLDLEARDE
jgi:uncharacterized protein